MKRLILFLSIIVLPVLASGQSKMKVCKCKCSCTTAKYKDENGRKYDVYLEKSTQQPYILVNGRKKYLKFEKRP